MQTTRVKQRRVGDGAVVGGQVEGDDRVEGVEGHLAVRQQRTLGVPGRARGVQNDPWIVDANGVLRRRCRRRCRCWCGRRRLHRRFEFIDGKHARAGFVGLRPAVHRGEKRCVDNDDGRRAVVQDPVHFGDREPPVHRQKQRAEAGAGKQQLEVFDAVFGDDGDARAGDDAEVDEGGRGGVDPFVQLHIREALPDDAAVVDVDDGFTVAEELAKANGPITGVHQCAPAAVCAAFAAKTPWAKP